MSQQDMTRMGGVQDAFMTTHWSMVDAVKQSGNRDSALVGLLMERYWKPVYCYLRRKGHDNEQAKDLTQGFFHEVVLNRQLIGRADPDRGSFRSLLLHALRHYVIDEQRKQSAGKQIPKDKLVSLDVKDTPELLEASVALDPEESFNYAWKADLLERALQEVKESYTSRGMDSHWQLFHARVVQPVLQDEAAPSLATLCTHYGIESEARASHMLDTVKRRFHKTLTKVVRQTVSTGQEVEDELGEMSKFLKKEGGMG